MNLAQQIEDLKAELADLAHDEPECTLQPIAAEEYDASCCGLHNDSSPWNRDVRARLEDRQSDYAYQRSGEWALDEEAA